jgi:nucleoside-diphosphate-sugar epimerase
MAQDAFMIRPDDRILVTGAAGFIGPTVVERLLTLGFRNVCAFVRPSSDIERLEAVADQAKGPSVEIMRGNLLSREDCAAATRNVAVIFHLAAGRSEKAFPDAFMNSVVTTRNLLDASLKQSSLQRFVNVSSFAVYTNKQKPRGRLLDEACPIKQNPQHLDDAYSFAKIKQEEIVAEYARRFAIPHVIVRPGYVYGRGNESITCRVGIGTFGLFLHLGGSNPIPFTYVDNCAHAIVLAGLKRGVNGEIFNIVDDDLPSSRHFLRLYKRHVGRFASIYVPHILSYALCVLWEKYSKWSEGQLPPVFNRRRWHAHWKKTRYSNDKLKMRLGWTPTVPMSEGLMRYFESCRTKGHHA